MDSHSKGIYQVILLKSAKDQLRASIAHAETPEAKSQFLEAVKAIVSYLAADPESWGDPLLQYEAAGLVQMHRVEKKILVNYAVDAAQKVVYLKECKPVLDHPLASS